MPHSLTALATDRVCERFWTKVNKNGPVPAHAPALGPCWVWTRGCKSGGYGIFRVGTANRDVVLAHRFAYTVTVGPIPAGLVLDHRCRNHACVRPSHLEAVTNAVNILRGIGPTAINHAKTHCPANHPYDEANTYRNPRTNRRACRACRRKRPRRAAKTYIAA
jgi:hypothetical protein